MIEATALIGDAPPVVGVLTRPDRADENGRPAVILLNAGRLHRVGPNRLYVRIARQLADHGLTVLRFDFSGIGDSEVRRDDLSLEQAMLHEARAALDHVAAVTGINRFVTVGLCEGARNAFSVARTDPRVVGVLMIDGFAYRTLGFYWRRARFVVWNRVSALFRRDGWKRLMAVSRSVGSADLEDEAEIETENDEPFPPKKAFLTEIQGLLGRGASLFFVYTSGGMHDFYNAETQLVEAFPSLASSPQIRVKYMTRTDHLFTLLPKQEEILAAVRDWVTTTRFQASS